MRQINFVIIFVICLALVLFGIENTEPAAIHIIEGVQLQAPLCVELLMAMGIGAVLAWVFSVWTQLQKMMESGKEIRQRDVRIEELEQNIQRYKVELEEQQHLLPASKPIDDSVDAEVFAQ
ncbi:LapA family protein [Oculatella sp. LEGE 06141]|uniref:lipopolysaccharide assembly protein LapA domain-containing protein n=1 Tax=Oculatella sp. LEGE 06141 TaxID=1828648 RepID=UPI00187E6051|nr:LapA family protein [Oculatella sp. LEGE 06141]MBE9179851.1 LapA family protein [Oculatella sp. LEGE 06141]